MTPSEPPPMPITVHGLYAKHGYVPVPEGRWMERQGPKERWQEPQGETPS